MEYRSSIKGKTAVFVVGFFESRFNRYGAGRLNRIYCGKKGLNVILYLGENKFRLSMVNEDGLRGGSELPGTGIKTCSYRTEEEGEEGHGSEF